ncbi:hypothetical protein [Phenylobacterium immobile]|uniref:hypothetical protein n=1 Tax=Phenylobacterium immobile TaxID=21 RepID=UPI00114773FB|nr:hypothetical protein [Phenylobacterium immobile]
MALRQPERTRAPARSSTPWRGPSGSARPYNALQQQNSRELAALRRQQAEFAEIRRQIDRQNQLLALPALAPVAAVLGLEGAGLAAAMLAKPAISTGQLVLTRRMPPLRGETWATRAGKKAHAEMRARVREKPGWESERYTKTNDGGYVRPDISAPVRSQAKNGERFLMELKPDTPYGRKAAAKAVKSYEEWTGNKARAIFYKQSDYRE